jgi:hypothetical protein
MGANKRVDPSADNVFSLPMKPLIYVSPGSALDLANRATSALPSKRSPSSRRRICPSPFQSAVTRMFC